MEPSGHVPSDPERPDETLRRLVDPRADRAELAAWRQREIELLEARPQEEEPGGSHPDRAHPPGVGQAHPDRLHLAGEEEGVLLRAERVPVVGVEGVGHEHAQGDHVCRRRLGRSQLPHRGGRGREDVQVPVAEVVAVPERVLEGTAHDAVHRPGEGELRPPREGDAARVVERARAVVGEPGEGAPHPRGPRADGVRAEVRVVRARALRQDRERDRRAEHDVSWAHVAFLRLAVPIAQDALLTAADSIPRGPSERDSGRDNDRPGYEEDDDGTDDRSVKRIRTRGVRSGDTGRVSTVTYSLQGTS